MVMRLPERDNYSYHRDKMYANLAVSMGGRVAEELIFGYDKVSSGASSDISYATGLARDMVTRWGMSDLQGRCSMRTRRKRCSSAIRSTASATCRTRPRRRSTRKSAAVVDEGYERAKHLLEENREELETLAKALLEFETLSGDEIKKFSPASPSTEAAPRARQSRRPAHRSRRRSGRSPALSAAPPPRELNP
jgi:cell division protease FtsH